MTMGPLEFYFDITFNRNPILYILFSIIGFAVLLAVAVGSVSIFGGFAVIIFLVFGIMVRKLRGE